MHEQKKDKTLFSSIPVETKHKITSLEMIGWSDPDETTRAVKSSKILKAMTHDNFSYPKECFDPK